MDVEMNPVGSRPGQVDELGPEVALSVVIPVRDGARYLGEQLDAVAKQDFDRDWEVIVADNGSTDDSVSVAWSFAGRLPALRVVDASARRGPAHARNIGARAARGRALVFLDADDLVQPGYLKAMAEALVESPIVGARLDCESLNAAWQLEARLPTEGIISPFGFLPFVGSGYMGIRRATFEALGGFDTTFLAAEDVDLSWRVQLAGDCDMRFVPEAVVAYRYKDNVRGLFDQGRGYGAALPALYRRYRDQGMPRRPWRAALRFHGGAFLRIVRARSREDRRTCAYLVGVRAGLVEGCVRDRVLYL